MILRLSSRKVRKSFEFTLDEKGYIWCGIGDDPPRRICLQGCHAGHRFHWWHPNDEDSIEYTVDQYLWKGKLLTKDGYFDFHPEMFRRKCTLKTSSPERFHIDAKSWYSMYVALWHGPDCCSKKDENGFDLPGRVFPAEETRRYVTIDGIQYRVNPTITKWVYDGVTFTARGGHRACNGERCKKWLHR